MKGGAQMQFVYESIAILSGLIAAIIGFCLGKRWLAVTGIVFVLSMFAGMFALSRTR